MKTNGVKQRLARNEPCFCDDSSFVRSIRVRIGEWACVDGIWLDMEHRPFNLETAQRLMIAARAGGNADVIVRTSRHEFSLVTSSA